jgi:hypothetical protein
VGLATLALTNADLSSPRISLTAPALGACVVALATFLLSNFGIAAEQFAAPLIVVMLGFAGVVVVRLRPRLPPAVWLVVAISVAGLLITATPMFSLGFRWLGNANLDMTNYVLSAQQLQHHGLAWSFDLPGFLRGRDYATTLTLLQRAGQRPGTDLLLALVASVTGREPYEVFMPCAFALSMAGICSVGALAAQSERTRWAAPLAAALLAVSALSAYSVLQQLAPQVFGLAVAAALFAVLLRPDIHREPARWRADLLPIGVLLAGVILAYVELAPTLAVIYIVYVSALAARREVTRRALVRLWLGPAVITVVLLNSYLPSEFGWLGKQVTHGTTISGHPPLFGYMFMPTALPTTLGLKPIAASPTSGMVGLSIAVAAGVLAMAVVLSVWHLRRGSAIAATLVAYAGLAVYLAINSADFGLFKLALYAQPFLAAGLAISVTRLRRRYLPVAAIAVIALFVLEFSTQQGYVNASRDPGDFRNASAADFLPVLHAAAEHARLPLVVGGANPVFLALAGASGYGKPLYFLGRDVFNGPIATGSAGGVTRSPTPQDTQLLQSDGVRPETFTTSSAGEPNDQFSVSPLAERSLSTGACTLVTPTGEQEPLNRLALPEGHQDLSVIPCKSAKDLLAFMSSSEGQNFYSFNAARNTVSYYELQGDPFFVGRTMAGLGRYALFQVLGPSVGMRMVLNYTFSFIHDGSNAIPATVVLGASKFAFPVAGRGSARVISPPLTPELIGGRPYLFLDIGKQPQIQYDHRRGLDALFGGSIPLDDRRLTGYLRDVSLISATQYAHLEPPSDVSEFPADLGNPNLAYSGIYEDGWVGQDSYVVLAGGPAANLVVHASIPAGEGGRVSVLIDGRIRAQVTVVPGALNLSVPVPRSAVVRKVELRFQRTIDLPAPDYRPVSALLTYVGFLPRRAVSR